MYFLDTDVNVDISAHSPNKKTGNVVKRVLRAIKG